MNTNNFTAKPENTMNTNDSTDMSENTMNTNDSTAMPENTTCNDINVLNENADKDFLNLCLEETERFGEAVSLASSIQSSVIEAQPVETNVAQEMSPGEEDALSTQAHCPVMLVLDTSHSMWGKGLHDMLVSLKVFCKVMEEEQFPEAVIELAAVGMGENLKVLDGFKTLGASALSKLAIRPKGDTPLGGGLDLALKTLDERILACRQAGVSLITPTLILLSDGQKSCDDFQGAVERIRRLCESGNLTCYAIAMGANPDTDTLEQIAGENVIYPAYGDLRQAFATVGKMVSRNCEDEALSQHLLPRAQSQPSDAVLEVPGEVPANGQAAASEATVTPGKARFLLDGSNILYWKGDRTKSLRYVLSIAQDFQRRGIDFQVFFDASAPYVVPACESKLLNKLLQKHPETFRMVPAGTQADAFLLLQADRHPECVVISQDCYRQYRKQYPWLTTAKRCVKGMVIDDEIYFPDLNLDVPVLPLPGEAAA